MIKLKEHKRLLCKKTFVQGSHTLFVKGKYYPVEHIGCVSYLTDELDQPWDQEWYNKLVYRAFEPEVTSEVKIPVSKVLARIMVSSNMVELETWLKAYREGYNDCREEQE
ncbi:hypothetical protein p113_130 [Enterococcus phage 113]|uniref:Uncharacterized protein n=1 Tax=Enterococcus phage 113 TaxID=2835638 RepID=A0A8E7FYS3_9CAUD|nr:hypothetical protein p113_130 [Enterococcus phage 113]